MSSSTSRVRSLLLLGCLSVITLIVAPTLGMDYIPLHTLWTAPDTLATSVLANIRLSRVLTAFCVGSALALSGAAFQSMFRNPLATPFTLGVAGGAALGSAIYIRLGLRLHIAGVNGVAIAAFTGSLLAIGLVYGLTRLRRGFSTASLLLTGVAVNFFFSSMIVFIQYISGQGHSFRIIRWMMGSVETVGMKPLLGLLPFVIPGAAILFLFSRELNLLAIGEDLASSRGVEINRVKQLVFFAASLMLGGIVAACGPIGFVGMMAPHICRMLVGHDHRFLLPGALLVGGVFLVMCDTLARTIVAPLEIPVGVITALTGGPFFLWMMLSGYGDKHR